MHELYLRNDIPCGLNLCKKCKYDDQFPIQVFNNADYSAVASVNHFLILDGLTILKFIDVLNEAVFK